MSSTNMDIGQEKVMSKGKFKRDKSKSLLEMAVVISTANENCEGDNWGDVVNLCGDADILIKQYEKEIQKLKDDIHYHTAMESAVGDAFAKDEAIIETLTTEVLKYRKRADEAEAELADCRTGYAMITPSPTSPPR